MDRWEYKVIVVSPKNLLDNLYKLGNNGWELSVALTDDHQILLIFKRLKREEVIVWPE